MLSPFAAESTNSPFRIALASPRQCSLRQVVRPVCVPWPFAVVIVVKPAAQPFGLFTKSNAASPVTTPENGTSGLLSLAAAVPEDSPPAEAAESDDSTAVGAAGA
jgi:hypothetical protein